MLDRLFLKSIREDLNIIHNNLGTADESDIELLVYGVISEITEMLDLGKSSKKAKSNSKSKIDFEIIEERVYPKDNYDRAKYILKRLRFHYPNYIKTLKYIKAQVCIGKTSGIKYLGIPPFEFHALSEDIRLYKQELKGPLKEFSTIFEEYFLNRLSLSKYAEKYLGDGSSKGKKRAENLLNRLYKALAKALELKDIAEEACAESKIDNEEFRIYKLMKEMENAQSLK